MAKAMCGISLFFIMIGGIYGIYRINYLSKAIATEATITKFIERKSGDGDVLYAPVYVFKDAAGIDTKIISSTASWPPIAEVGDTIEILYLPDDPKRSIINRFFSKWGFAAIACGLGSFYFILFAIVAYFTGKRIKIQCEQAAPSNP
jgi:hypothetical protein